MKQGISAVKAFLEDGARVLSDDEVADFWTICLRDWGREYCDRILAWCEEVIAFKLLTGDQS